MKRASILAILLAATLAVGYERVVVLEEAYSEG